MNRFSSSSRRHMGTTTTYANNNNARSLLFISALALVFLCNLFFLREETITASVVFSSVRRLGRGNGGHGGNGDEETKTMKCDGITGTGTFTCLTSLLSNSFREFQMGRGKGKLMTMMKQASTGWSSKNVGGGSDDVALFYTEQLVDHFTRQGGNLLGRGGEDGVVVLDGETRSSAGTQRLWTQRYYASSDHFGGPGNPVFLVMGGEGAMNKGMYYPFVTQHLAKEFRAGVIQPEHRFYGKSQPILAREARASNFDLAKYLTPSQAMADYVRLARHVMSKDLGCSMDRSSPGYCPVITVGGSYPGFLSAMMRLRHADFVDMAYAASAPMKFYSQEVEQYDYYNLITESAERASKACPHAVKNALMDVANELLVEGRGKESDGESFVDVARRLGVCPDTIPEYITTKSTFCDELNMIVGYTFANYNMANYPPSEKTTLAMSCRLFQNETLSSFQKVGLFLRNITKSNSEKNNCFDMSTQLPSGTNATISSGDWSGVGTGDDGKMWDFQTCSLLVEAIGFSNKSMFVPRNWTMEWLQGHCKRRFGILPQPTKLVNEWVFDDLTNKTGGGTYTSRILFTNGLNDGWSVGAIKENLSESVLAINFENGAHHSDLSHIGPSKHDTIDIRNGFVQIKEILQSWLVQIRKEQGVVRERFPTAA